MGIKFFGQHLLANNVVTADQLRSVIELQETQNLRLGEIAINQGYLAEADAKRVNDMQQQKDLRFGGAAIELGLLTGEQVDELVARQRANHRYLGDVVVELGFASRDIVEAELAAYQQEQREYEATSLSVPAEVPIAELAAHMFDFTHKLLLRVWGVQSKIGAVQTHHDRMSLGDLAVEVTLTGDLETRYFLAVPMAVAQRGAKQVLGSSDVPLEDYRDLTRELANVVCGNIVARLSQEGKTADISPPASIDTSIALSDNKAVSLQLHTPYGDAVTAVTY